MIEAINDNNSMTLRLHRFPWRLYIIGVVLALTVAVILMRLVMQAPTSDIVTLVSTLTFTSFLSLVMGYFVVRRSGARYPSLSKTLTLTYGWSAVLVLFNVLFMLSQMYLNPHDLVLSGILLLFASIISTTFGIFVSANVTDGLRQLEQTALQIAEGNLEARAIIQGHDEVARLGQVFNEMATQLQAAASQREELDRLRTDLIAWTSHDLRTPLTSIRAMIEALHDGIVTDDDTITRYYSTIRSDIIALNTLIDDLFELAQLDAGGLRLEFDEHSLSDIISDSLESFQALAQQRGIVLRGDVRPPLDPVLLNAPKIGRVLSNLLSNALRYTPAGGQVVVCAWREQNEAVVTVQDSGPGFDAQDIPRLFEQFYRGEEARSRSTGGAGLGLAIARGIVEAHGGTIWAENGENGGAIVGIRLPLG